MKKLVLALFLFLPCRMYADNWPSVAIDGNLMPVSAFGRTAVFTWAGVELNDQFSWKSTGPWPSGIAFGFRKDSLQQLDGIYLALRTVKTLPGKTWNRSYSVGILYGSTGRQFDRTWRDTSVPPYGRYTHLYPSQYVGIPNLEVSHAGTIFPEAAFSMKKRSGRMGFEPYAAMRFMGFGAVRSDYRTVEHHDALGVTLSVGLKVSLHTP